MLDRSKSGLFEMKKETRQLIPKMFVTGARLHTPSDRLECLSFSPTTLKNLGCIVMMVMLFWFPIHIAHHFFRAKGRAVGSIIDHSFALQTFINPSTKKSYQ
jgi:hypothetical protein